MSHTRSDNPRARVRREQAGRLLGEIEGPEVAISLKPAKYAVSPPK
jgi:hypothetical protein